MEIDVRMKDFFLDLLDKELSEVYFFHNRHHTLYVYEKALEIAIHEDCSEDDKRLLAAAALCHDTGYIKGKVNHEAESCNLARRFLPDFGFSNLEIEKICIVIMATKIPQKPQDKLGEILADADLEYLGTDLASAEADKLFQEIFAGNSAFTLLEWDAMQVEFISHHQYFTAFCKAHREPRKQSYLAEIQARLTGSRC
jgi:HD superfamily phosphodiesterase